MNEAKTCARRLALFCLALALPAAHAVTAIDGDTAVASFQSEYVSDAFEAVAERIAYEPYAGVQRGAVGTALAGSANSIDQALLLARALDGQVAALRFVQGRLDDETLTQLLAATSQSVDAMPGGAVQGLYDPVNDDAVRKTARDHVWLEIKREAGDDWFALDPAFPGATPGQSFGRTQRSFEAPPARLHQTLTVTLMQETANGRRQRVGRVSGNVADLSREPIALVVRGIPQYDPASAPATEDDPGLLEGTPGGLLGGGLGGGASRQPKTDTEERPADAEPVERVVTGVAYRREISHAGNEPEALEATRVTYADDSSYITREWLEFELGVPGQRKRRVARDLFVAAETGELPAAVRRYSVAVIAGELSAAAFEGQRQRLDPALARATRARLDAMGGDASDESALELMQLESSAALTPHLINLAFASESDTLSRRLAAAAGVRIVRDLPRILITSIETSLAEDGTVSTNTTLDLRLDEVRALPLTGMPVGAAPLFQRARGMQESALEGRVLARFVQDPDSVVTTTRVLGEAQRQGRELVVLTADRRDDIARLEALPEPVEARIVAALDGGHQVIVPNGAARIGGADRWGWWDVDPATGAFVGVMESGQHQAMAQYTVTLEKIGVNDAMGYVIGALVGSTATMTLYSAKMLEYGQVTPELIAEVAAGIESLTCVTCPSFEVIVSPMAASASFESTCFEQTGVSIGTGGGVSGSISFCENYKLGISCAASLMLGTFNVEGDVSIGPNVNLDLGPLSCD